MSTTDTGWRLPRRNPSLPEAFRTVRIRGTGLRRFSAFVGPGFLVAVGYMDPGNWATDLAGGSRFGYALLSVVVLSSVIAMVLQSLSARLGIVSGRDLAQACHDQFPPAVSFALWILAELAITATDLAEVIGSAIAIQLLFGLPLLVGVLITSLDVLIVLLLQRTGYRWLEAFVAGLVFTVGVCFSVELILARPNLFDLASGIVPRANLITNPEMLYLGLGILGATVMPHNLYLHSSIVQSRDYGRDDAGKREAIRFASIDSTSALVLALLVNGAILVLSAAVFYGSGTEVAEIQDAYRLLAPALGTTAASLLFGIALLAAGQNSTLTGTLAGQVVMEGFLNIRLAPWLRRLLTRLAAIVPAIVVTAIRGEAGTGDLLVLSQVVLSLQLSFAVVPLVFFTSDKAKMRVFAINGWLKWVSWLIALLIAAANAWLLMGMFGR